MDIDLDRLRYLDEIMPANVTTIYSDPHAVADYAVNADLVIGAVLVPGGKAPKLIDESLVERMKAGSVIVDVCIDQGGCVGTARPTTHHEPTYVVHGVVHYCVTNIPGAVGRTSSQALCNATLPYVRELASLGAEAFAKANEGHGEAINMRGHRIVHKQVAQTFADLPGE
jgi:alanine dehydrogenase